MGADEIIAVDLQEIGFKKSINKKIKNITYITPKNKLKNFLFFDKEEAKKQIKLGYNDTMKIYKRLYGNSFSFNKIFYSINEFAYFKKFIRNFENKSKVVTKLGKTVKYMHYHQIIENENPKEIFLNSIEYLMNILDLQEEDIWNILNVNHIIKEEMAKINSISFKNLEKIIKNKEEVNEEY
ncbi:MAG: hypothetical protein LRY26_00185 [Bacilli bacterium]|nr:hypothetical protein [Bacilli bacterium]